MKTSSFIHRLTGITVILGISAFGIAPAFAQDKPSTAAPTADPIPEAVAEGGAPELTEAADLAIERGLQYLLATQKPDGS